MANDYGFVRNFDSLKFIVSKLCEHGFASYTEKLVTNVAHEFFPDEFVCDTLIKGWCVDGKLDEARRLSQEMYRDGFEIDSVGYNAILDCVCRVCRKKDPFGVRSEAEKVLIDMDSTLCTKVYHFSISVVGFTPINLIVFVNNTKKLSN
ncbi:hypothetical protein L6452_08414 [Arctium lappa]|uniref:Uncharacterized protein n=1 Tax=Arctium lappa TaxID=4217 RepID=A0ACB9DH88_ARCLA|nr:hypothetical protein L6452_08414 [Arctium lappa]